MGRRNELLLIAEQIEWAEREAREKGEGTSAAGVVEGEEKKQEEDLQHEEGEKVVMAFSAKPTLASSSTTPSDGLKPNPFKLAINPLKANPLKRTNPLKQASSSSSATDNLKSSGKWNETPLSTAEKLILEEEERKRRRVARGSSK